MKINSGKFSIIWLFRRFYHQSNAGKEGKISIFLKLWIHFIRNPSSLKKENCSLSRINGGIKAIVNEEESSSKRNSADEEKTDSQNSGHSVRLLEKKQQTGNSKRNRDNEEQTSEDQNVGHAEVRVLQRQNRDINDEETSDDQNIGHAEVRVLQRQRRRERIQEEKEKRAAVVRCLFVFFLLFAIDY